MLSQTQLSTLALWQQINASLSAYHKLIKAFFNADNALQASCAEWQELGLHARHIERHRDRNSTEKLLQQVSTAVQQGQYQLLFANQALFPKQLFELFDPPPLLFVKGNVARLHEAQIAIVGSRKPTPHAQKITFDMAQYLAQAGYIITSGLAQGVDYHAHMGALTQADGLLKGRTVGVMGTGIDVCYPRHHNSLFTQIVAEGGCLISELLPQTIANKHTFPRRNRIVAGLSLGTIVTEAMINSGSLITARLTSEQGKQVFAVQVQESTNQPLLQPQETKAKATVALMTPAKTASPQQTTTVLPLPDTKLPKHLDKLFALIDWIGADVDSLMLALTIDTQTLLGQLMELELMGLIQQQGGRYVRV